MFLTCALRITFITMKNDARRLVSEGGALQLRHRRFFLRWKSINLNAVLKGQ